MSKVMEATLSTVLQVIQGMLEIADSDIKALMLSQEPPISLHQSLLQSMLDRHLEQRLRLSVYQTQCADWHRERLTTQQVDMLTTVEAHLVYLKQCNQHLIQLLASLRLATQSEEALLKGSAWQLH